MIIFTDIDDTLMKTSRKIDQDVSTLTVGALNKKGKPNSYIEKKREKLIIELINKSISIPVSARSIVGLSNLKIKFNHHAILNFGATILNKNKLLMNSWNKIISLKSRELKQEVIFNKINILFGLILEDFECKIAYEDKLCVYMNFRDNEQEKDKLNLLRVNLESFLREEGWLDKFYFYQTDRDLSIIPTFIRKEHAVSYLIEKVYSKEDLIIGLGDHKNDLSFMSVCDFALMPTDSMLMKMLKEG